MITFRCIRVVIISFSIIRVCPALRLGDVCELKNDYRSVCKRPENCTKIVQHISNGVYLRVCGLDGTTVLVCCPEMTEPESSTFFDYGDSYDDDGLIFDYSKKNNINQQATRGDVCNRGEGQDEICVNISSCPTAVADLTKGVARPQICGYDGKRPLVCCVRDRIGKIVNERVCNSSGTTNKGQDQICVDISSCPTAFADLTKGVARHQICGYERKTFLVCCAPDRRSAMIVDEMCDKYNKMPNECSTVSIAGAGGIEADGGEFPHMALLGYGETEEYREWKCGGSLISERFVLTAAHCVAVPNTVKVIRLGELNYNTDTDDADPEDFNIAEMLVHPNYTTTSVYDDIALLKLDRDAKFGRYIRPTCLNTSPMTKEQPSVATGWGQLGVGLPVSDHLMKMEIPIVSIDKCKQFFGVANKYRFGIDEKSQLCAGELKGGIDTCTGDSGGPIQIKLDCRVKVYRQVGITSFGDSFCALKGQPAVYTRVSHYLNWIQQIVWPI